jgi:FAD-dependent oxidoreductase domain-containing protein 1
MTSDVVIIGGGVVGSSIAYHLRRDGFTGRIVVVERDPTYARASSSLAMGGIRQQFGSAVNIAMARFSVRFYERFDELMSVGGYQSDAWLRQRGYLFLVDAAGRDRFERRVERQRALGADVERWSVDEIRRRVPDLMLDDIELGVFGPSDGYANPKRVLAGFRAGAAHAGAEYVTAEVTAIDRTNGRVSGIAMRGLEGPEYVATETVVNAAGAYAARVGRMAGIDLPVQPVRQHLFRCALPRPWPYRFPMVIDPGGVHWRHDDASAQGEADRIIVARTKLDEPPGEDLTCDPSRWPRDFAPDLMRRVPAFRDITLLEGWAGLYEMTPDHNAVIGEHPDVRGLFLANGFSGHGLMMAPATGKVVSELIRLGRAETVDVSALSVERFARGELFWDEAMV